MSLPTLTIHVDQREHRPLPFPEVIDLATELPSSHAIRRVAIKVQERRLPTADYLLEDGGVLYSASSSFTPPVVAVETKRSLSEIAGNVLTDTGRSRFVRLLQRMRELHAAWLVIEGGLSTLYQDAPRARRPRGTLTGLGVGGSPPFNPVCARDHLISLCCQWRIHPYILEGSGLAARQRAADFVARLLVYGGAPDAKDLAAHLEQAST